MNVLIRCLFILSLMVFSMSTTEAVGFVVSHSDLKPTLVAPAGEILTVTPTLQWKMNWVKESNPQPSPSPQRLEFTVIVFHKDRPVWESPPKTGVSGQSMYEMQLPAGVIGPIGGPPEDFNWQVIAQFYDGTTPGRKSVSEIKPFHLRSGCQVPVKTMRNVNNVSDARNPVLPGVRVSAYSGQNRNLLLAQAVSGDNGIALMNFSICPVPPSDKTTAELYDMMPGNGPVYWVFEKNERLYPVACGYYQDVRQNLVFFKVK